MELRKHLLVLFLVCILLGSLAAPTAALEFTGLGGSTITTSGFVSVQGTMNETVSVTCTTFGSAGKETTEWSVTNSFMNPAAVSWNSRMTIIPVEGTLTWNYVRTGGFAPLAPVTPWQPFFR